MIRFIFDLDGTVTTKETLPIISKQFNIENDIEALTSQTVAGNIPFVESFIKRVHLMGDLPVDEVSRILEGVPLYPKIGRFIKEYTNQCVIATGNLDCWVDRLCNKVGCDSYTSKASVLDNKITKIEVILRKENIVKKYQSMGDIVVFIGEGNNDLEAMRQANISIASGLTHSPSNSVLGITDYVVFGEDALCRQLTQLL